MQLTEEMKKEYRELYSTAKVRDNKTESLAWYTNRIQKNQGRYQAVSAKTGVPWYVIAAIHMMESSGDFSTHLHNGDPLTARTVHVPAGRPKTHVPPFTWEESAIDALGYDGATNVEKWDLEHTLFWCEMYNGSGYRTGSGVNTTPPKRSAYLWSFTNQYLMGRYIEDGHFDPNSISDQAGMCAMFLALEARGLMPSLLGDNTTPQTPPVQPPGHKDAEVTWFELFRLEDNGGCITGCVARASATPVATWTGIDYHAMYNFMSQYKNASHVLVAPVSKPWPGALKVTP